MMDNPYFQKLQDLGMTLSLREISGSTWGDSMGSNDGSLVGNPTVDDPGSHGFPVTCGPVATFNGTNQYLNLGHKSAFEPNQRFTLAHWVLPLGETESWAQWAGKGDTYQHRRIAGEDWRANYRWNIFTGGGTVRNSDARIPDSDDFLSASPRLVVCRRHDDNIRAFYSDNNGVMRSYHQLFGVTGSLDTDSSASLAWMARVISTPDRFIHGRLAAPAMSNSVGLDTAQAQELYDSAFEPWDPIDYDPASMDVVVSEGTASLTWSAPVMSGATHVDIFRRGPYTSQGAVNNNPFDPSSDDRIARVSVGTLSYEDTPSEPGWYAWQTFPLTVG